MTIRIGSNIASLTAQRRLGEATSSLGDTYSRLSSGQRINKASDDAAGLAISSSLNSLSRIYSVGIRNINDSVSLLNIQASAFSAMQDITVRQKELAEQAANGVYSAKQREAINNEARALTDEYNRIVLGTKFNGRDILATPWEELTTQAGIGTDGTLAFKFADSLMEKINPGDYFTVDGVSSKYYVWFSVDGQGTDPSVAGMTGLRVDLSSSSGNESTSITLPVDGNNYLDVASGSYFTINSADEQFYVWFDNGGAIDPAPGGTGIKIIPTPGVQETTTLDLISNSNGFFTADFWYLEIYDGTDLFSIALSGGGAGTQIPVAYQYYTPEDDQVLTMTFSAATYGTYFQYDGNTYYFDDGSETYNPNLGNDIAIDISSVVGDDPSAVVVSALQAQGYLAGLNGSYEIQFAAIGRGSELTAYNGSIVSATPGNVYVPESGTQADQLAADMAAAIAATGRFTASSSGTQLIITANSYSESIDFNDNGGGAIINITRQGSDTSSDPDIVATQIASALAATGKFSASSSGGGSISVTTSSGGDIIDATAGNSGASVVVTTQGSSVGGNISLDGATVAAKVSAALNSTGDFTTQLSGSQLRITNNTAGQGGVNDVSTGIFIKDNVSSGNYSSTILSFGDARGTLLVNHLDLNSQSTARAALDTVTNRLDRIGAQIGILGSVQSRFSVASSVLTTTRENYLAAESRIKDADIAFESSNLVRNQILQQAASSVLAQANQQPSLALTLLN